MLGWDRRDCWTAIGRRGRDDRLDDGGWTKGSMEARRALSAWLDTELGCDRA